ncbi:zinc finger protein GAI-ASSOCIATED FACTOR 1-like isoform X2 [Macadamia integrifolia]|uniref:zinc finger protein GAI-ASSOCIATED FACTOR 1-like isoform X2 n=1 Tax=Macadamia integrifolia TaxID=60698 RepID=UPI001C52F37D|nr:zinc finger protein GAI-ASSOCIATED FACTOR 1-like isoform X2 [Macadamia integrifolia]
MNPNAEVIALSPKTLMATNRFVCEICNKGFQRDQNLQLHRRGHNLPWKLKQRTGNEIRKRVYICPEPNCVHHNPVRALGDLTGIKKHFCRKHGEKKWKCDKCLKKYAVQSDWKAHSKTCGTKEYKCDCGTIFSRRDSFITHRAFCDALTEENNKISHGLTTTFVGNLQGKVSDLMSPIGVPEFNHQEVKNPLKSFPVPEDLMSVQLRSPGMSGSLFSSSPSTTLFGGPRSNISSSSSCLLGSSAHISATALLQKAAQMGATTSNTINTPMMQKTLVTSMAGPDQLSGMNNGGFTNHFSRVNDIGMFSGMFMGGPDHQNHGLLKKIENENGRNLVGGSRFGGDDMMTVDFLGIGGSISTNLSEKHQGIHHFQQQISHEQAEMEKSLWDI